MRIAGLIREQEEIEALSVLQTLIEVLASEIPANIRAPKNERLVTSMQRVLARYFRELGDALPIERVEQIYYKHVKQEA